MSKKLFRKEKNIGSSKSPSPKNFSLSPRENRSLHQASLKNVDLSLEIEMNESVRNIITQPDKHKSSLLDVTVLKQKNCDSVYEIETKTLNSLETRKLIAAMEYEKQYKKSLIDKILSQKLSHHTMMHLLKQHSNHSHTKRNSEKDHNATYFSDDHSDASNLGEIQQIYTSCSRQYNDVRKIFECEKKNRSDDEEKPELPCSCKNCAIFGVLQDSQKRPYIEPQNPKDCGCKNSSPNKITEKLFKNKKVSWKNNDHLECEHYFKYLSSKIKELEERLARQEEKAVPKDHFKRIVTKLVNHIGKLTGSNGSNSKEERSISNKAYDKNYQKPIQVYPHTTSPYSTKYGIHPILLNDLKPDKLDADLEKTVSQLEFLIPTKQSGKPSNPNFWKWGEEILKPGVDLKNKIQSLLEESMNTFRPESRAHRINRHDHEKEIRRIYPNQNIQVHNAQMRYFNENLLRHPDVLFKNSNSDSTIYIKNNPRRYRRVSKRRNERLEPFREVPDGLFNNNVIPSNISFKMNSSDKEVSRKCNEKQYDENDVYKIEFLKTLSHTKDSDKLKLWQSIWKQALLNGQSKSDQVTIQIPQSKDKQDNPIEIQYTLGELEMLLVRNKCTKKLKKLIERRRQMLQEQALNQQH